MQKCYKGSISLPKFEVSMMAVLTHLQNKNYAQTKQSKTQLKITCSNKTIEIFEEGVKYVQR